MNEEEYADLMKRKNMFNLPMTTIILLAFEGQSICEKPPQEFYNIFQILFV